MVTISISARKAISEGAMPCGKGKAIMRYGIDTDAVHVTTVN
jgi:hypothetical protein